MPRDHHAIRVYLNQLLAEEQSSSRHQIFVDLIRNDTKQNERIQHIETKLAEQEKQAIKDESSFKCWIGDLRAELAREAQVAADEKAAQIKRMTALEIRLTKREWRDREQRRQKKAREKRFRFWIPILVGLILGLVGLLAS